VPLSGQPDRQFVFPADWLDYYNWLHAHSHIAFLGWVYFALIAFIAKEYLDQSSKGYAWIIILTQISVFGMLFTFARTGYSLSAISFSAMHMILSIIIAMIIFNRLKGSRNLSARLIRISFLFMILSGIGPLALGPILGMGLRDSIWYDMSIYLYLHFQYNGWFMMAIIGIIAKFLERNDILMQNTRAQQSVILLIVGIILTYLL